MDEKFTAKAEISINATKAEVWEALTNPELIKQYLFGTNVETDWKVGSPIVYKGQWQGKTYEDKGKILKIETEKVLVSTYWSSMTGAADLPENYNTVTYELSEDGSSVRLTITQDNVKSEDDKTHSEQNWQTVLTSIKNLLEK